MTMTLSQGSDKDFGFNHTRLTLAREREGITKQKLAERCHVSRRTVSLWESGEVENPPIETISKALNLPPDFFCADDAPEVYSEWISFRALSRMSGRQHARVVAVSRIAVEFSDWIEDRYRVPSLDVPSIPISEPNDSPSLAATNIRFHWSLSDKPIRDILTLLEKKGVRIFSLPNKDREVDAFSFCREGRAYIFLNTSKSAERMRFDLAHELGHLVLHRGSQLNKSREAENEAHKFASNLLISTDRLKTQIVGNLRLEDVFRLKRYWGVSSLAMVECLWQLDCISEWTRRQWIIDLTKLGYRSAEPDGQNAETSKFFAQLFKIIREDGYKLKSVARELKLNPEDLDEYVFGLAIGGVAGPFAGITGEGQQEESRKYGHLKRIK